MTTHTQASTELRKKLDEFFNNNPDEELTFDDIAAKFSVPVGLASRTVYSMADRGELESIHVIRRAR